MPSADKLLKQLIAIPSVNPAFLPASHPHGGEKRMADFIGTTASRLGLEVDFENVLPGRPNVMIRLLPSGKPKQRIVLAPHLDTVGIAEGGFDPVVRGSRIHGRGACDTKGSVAAMLTALFQLALKKRRPQNTEIVFAGLIDEESAQSGSRALVASRFTADLAIVGEPTQLKVVTAHKGDLWLLFEATGRAAHGSQPHLGINAVHEMAKVVQALETDYAADLKRRVHPVLRNGSINVGTIAGGTQPNIVPAHCTMSADRRTLPGETERSVLEELRTLLRRKKLRTTVKSIKAAPCFPLETDARLPLVAQFLRSASQPKPAGVDYFCDASVLSAGGIPSVVFGPGNIAQAHTVDEWISIRSLDRAVNMLLRFLESLP